MLVINHKNQVRFVHGVPYVPFITQACVDNLRQHFNPQASDVFIVTRLVKCAVFLF